MSIKWRVDFDERGPDQQRFHKAFTFTLADTAEEAAAKIIAVRPGSEVKIINTRKARR